MATEKHQKHASEKKPDLGLLEEDDEFEEFPTEGRTYFLNEFSTKNTQWATINVRCRKTVVYIKFF